MTLDSTSDCRGERQFEIETQWIATLLRSADAAGPHGQKRRHRIATGRPGIFKSIDLFVWRYWLHTHIHRSRVSIRKWMNRRIFYRPLVTRSYRHWRSVCGWPKPNWTSTIIIPCCLSTKRWTICPARPPPVAKVRALADWTDCDLFFCYPRPLSNNIPANMLLFVFFYI